MPDVAVSDHGTVFLFRPLTRAAESWIADNVADRDSLWLGDALAVEARFAERLTLGMESDGITVQ